MLQHDNLVGMTNGFYALENKRVEEDNLSKSELLVNNLREQLRRQEEIERLAQSLVELEEEARELEDEKAFDPFPLFHKKEKEKKAYSEYMKKEAMCNREYAPDFRVENIDERISDEFEGKDFFIQAIKNARQRARGNGKILQFEIVLERTLKDLYERTIPAYDAYDQIYNFARYYGDRPGRTSKYIRLTNPEDRYINVKNRCMR